MIRRLAGLWAVVAISAGAFGAHAANGQAVEWLKTGALYQLVHAVAAIAIADRAPKPALIMLIGSGIFAASLYLMAMGAPHLFGAVTPAGGVMMIFAWIWFALSR